MSEKADYRSSGVDIDEGERAVALMRAEVRSTFNNAVLSDVGQFGGLFRAGFPGISKPVLVASTDGVGTKLKVAAMIGDYTTVGKDLVNHCINDILVQGASPLFFMDYIACGQLSASVVAEIVSGLASACRDSDCALLGGETAEMPGFYSRGDYDVAGTIVGIVEESRILNGSSILAGDVIVGLPSNGLHTNGYSLARRVLFQMAGLKVGDTSPLIGGMNLGDALLQVHRCYLKPVAPLLQRDLVKGLAHITGGGIPGNLSRILPGGFGAMIDGEWDVPGIFRLIQELGEVDRGEMLRAFNMGAGMLAVIGEGHLEEAVRILESFGEKPFVAGRVVKGDSVDFGGPWDQGSSW